jgi:hypothetical protein
VLDPQGGAALRRWIDLPERDPMNNLNLLLLKLFFGDYGDPAAVLALVERYRDQTAEHLDALRTVDAEAVFVAPEQLPRLTLRFGLAAVKAQLDWANAILPDLRARLPPADRAHARRADHPQPKGMLMHEATAVETPYGRYITTDGWFVLNLSDALAVQNEQKGGASYPLESQEHPFTSSGCTSGFCPQASPTRSTTPKVPSGASQF